jgi:hypothetical protein
MSGLPRDIYCSVGVCTHLKLVLSVTQGLTHKLELKMFLKKPREKTSVVALGAPDCLVVPWRAVPESPERYQRESKGLAKFLDRHRTVQCAPDSHCAVSGAPLCNG